MALNKKIITGTRRVGTGLTEARDRAVDEARIELVDVFVIKTVLLQPTDFEVLYEHVGFCGQGPDEFLPFGLGQINRHRSLVAIAAEIIGGVLGFAALGILEKRRAPRPRVISEFRALDLNDIGPKVSELLGRPRPRKNSG